MKRISILTIAFLLAFVSLNAQLTQKRVENKLLSTIDNGNTVVTNSQISPLRVGGAVPLSGSQNIYSIISGATKQVIYNEDLNTVVFIHRAPSGVGAGSSGELVYDYSTDGGHTWNTEKWITQEMDGQAYCRYPSVAIYNPQGNTDISNARVIANGPALIPSPYGWGYSFEIDATFNESGNPTTHEYYGSNNGDNTDFHPFGLSVSPDGHVWSVNIGYQDDDYITDLHINRAEWDGALSKMVWTSPLEDISPDYTQTGLNDMPEFLFGWDMAVDPIHADTVYMVIAANLVGDTTNVVLPHVWKTVDGGDTWTKMPSIDIFDTLVHPILDSLLVYEEEQFARPFITDISCTVDANGTLHIFSDVSSGAADWGYTWQAAPNNPTDFYMDFMLSDSTWSVMYVGSQVSQPAGFGEVKTYKHPQISRTPDAKQIIYTWNETLDNPDSLNTTPNIFVYYWDVYGHTADSVINLTKGTGAQGICYFHQISPISISRSDSTVEIPIVIPAIDFADGSDSDPVDYYYYLYDFTVPYTAFDSTNTEIKKFVDNKVNTVFVYPNPASSRLIINNTSSKEKIKILSVVGQTIRTYQANDKLTVLDIANLPEGTYIIRVETENGVASSKFVKVK